MKFCTLFFIFVTLSTPQLTLAFIEEDGFLLDYVQEPTHYCNLLGPGSSLYILDDFTSEGHSFPFFNYEQGSRSNRLRMRMYEGTETVVLDGEEIQDYFYGFIYLDADDFRSFPGEDLYKGIGAFAGRFVVKAEDADCRLIETEGEDQ